MKKEKNIKEIKGMFEGPILPITIKLAMPIFLSQIFQVLYTIVDTMFIAMIDRSSTALISGTGLVFPIFFLFMALGIGLNVGISSLVARGIGEKNKDVLISAPESGLVIIGVITFFTLLSGYLFGRPIIQTLSGTGMSEEALRVGLRYLHFLLPGLAFMLINNLLFGIAQGEGRNKYVAIAMTISTVSNLILDPILIFGFHLGVKGAALATSIAIFISTLYLVSVFIRKDFSVPISANLLKAKLSLIKEIIRIGGPRALSMMSLSIAFMFLNNITSSIGQNAMNSWTICGRSDQMVFLPAIAISTATITMVGQNYGRNNLTRVKEIHKKNILFTIAVISMMAVFYNIIAPQLFKAFTSVENVIAGSVLQVRVLSFTYLGIAILMVCSATFQATGSFIPALVFNIIRMFALSVPLAHLLVYYYDLKMMGVYIALGSGNIIVALISLGWIKRYLKNLTFIAVKMD